MGLSQEPKILHGDFQKDLRLLSFSHFAESSCTFNPPSSAVSHTLWPNLGYTRWQHQKIGPSLLINSSATNKPKNLGEILIIHRDFVGSTGKPQREAPALDRELQKWRVRKNQWGWGNMRQYVYPGTKKFWKFVAWKHQLSSDGQSQ